ncbi:protein of unknown function (DUF3328) domain containing protein [Rhypophila sp. PSN 637]
MSYLPSAPGYGYHPLEKDIGSPRLDAIHETGSDSAETERDYTNDDYHEAEKATGRNGLSKRHLFSLFCSFILLVLSEVTVFNLQSNLGTLCLEYMEPWSPLATSVEFTQHRLDWESCPEKYCGGVEPQREQAWRALWDYGWIGFPRQKLATLNKSPHVEWLHLLGSGQEDNLVSIPEFTHQFHCLYMLRRVVYGEVEHHEDESKEIERARMWLHVDHCLLSLKNVIECRADATPVVLASQKDGSWTLKDAPRHCKNHQRLLDSYAEKTVCFTNCNANEVYENGR